MSWCPNCKEEYEDHVQTCAECGEALTSELVSESEVTEIEAIIKEPVYVERDEAIIDGELKLLYMAQSEEEVQIVTSYLHASGITVLRKDRGAGSYLNIVYGYSTQGTDLYVLEQDFNEAEKFIEEMDYSHHLPRQQAKELQDIDDMEAAELAFRKRRQSIIWGIIAIMIVIPALFIMIIG